MLHIDTKLFYTLETDYSMTPASRNFEMHRWDQAALGRGNADA